MSAKRRAGRRLGTVLVCLVVAGWAAIPHAQAGSGKKATVLRMYALDCGDIHSTDMSRWMDGINVGREVAQVMAAEKAELWINHEKTQCDRLPHAPMFIE